TLARHRAGADPVCAAPVRAAGAFLFALLVRAAALFWFDGCAQPDRRGRVHRLVCPRWRFRRRSRTDPPAQTALTGSSAVDAAPGAHQPTRWLVVGANPAVEPLGDSYDY